MKDIINYETAVRLKEAGFPQPTPEAGQWWYMIGFNTPRLAIVGLWGTADKRPVYRYLDANTWDFPDERESIFAPTATDILRELDDLFFIRKSMYESKPIFSMFDEKRAENGLNVALSIDYNPAEAAAEAWIKLNDKK